MPRFRYQALSAQGQEQTGAIEAAHERAARESLRTQGLTPLSLTLLAPRVVGTQLRLREPVLAACLRRLATLVGAGIPVTDALHTLARQSSQPAEQTLLKALAATLEEGGTLGAGLAKWPEVFPATLVASVAAGERGGRLALVLEQVADATERERLRGHRLLAALVYPAVLFVVAIAVAMLMLLWVLPQLAEAYTQAGVALPALTRMLLALGAGLEQSWPVFVLLLLGGAFALPWIVRIPGLRGRIADWGLYLPVFGAVMRAQTGVRLTRGLALMLQGGVPMIEALAIAQGLVAAPSLANRLARVREAVTGGMGLAPALAKEAVLPPMALDLIAAGEASGRLPALLERAATTEETELAARMDLALALVEPVLVVLIGVIVLVVVLAVLSPLAGLYDLVG